MTCGIIPCYKDGCRRCDPDFREPFPEETDPLYAALVAARHYLEAGWERTADDRVSPFEKLSLRYCITSTNHTVGLGRARQQARDELVAMLENARQRFRSGFYANPFGEPVRRSA